SAISPATRRSRAPCCARAASCQASAAPPITVMSSRRLMSDLGPPAQELTEPCCRTRSLPQRGRQVIEANLNCSELGVGGVAREDVEPTIAYHIRCQQDKAP